MNSNDYKAAIERLGRFGRLFVEYSGCPRGQIGRHAAPLEEEVFYMGPVTDVEGETWIPVNKQALEELVAEYKTYKEICIGNNKKSTLPLERQGAAEEVPHRIIGTIYSLPDFCGHVKWLLHMTGAVLAALVAAWFFVAPVLRPQDTLGLWAVALAAGWLAGVAYKAAWRCL